MAMCSREVGADLTFAWPHAQTAVMGAEQAVDLVFRRRIEAAADPEAEHARIVEEYKRLFNNPYYAAARGHINAVILPRDTRPILINALEALSTKSQSPPARRHGNIPL